MEIQHSQHFKRAYKKLSGEIKQKAEKRENIFRKDPFDPKLQTHKLHGKFSDF